jgi:hypothetical protein
MPHKPVIQQYNYEIESWKRLLAFFIDENTHFKIRLSEILNEADDEETLLNGEQFQENFLSQDKILSFLEAEVKRQKKLLERETYEDGELFKEVVKNQKKLRRDIEKGQEFFTKVNDSFLDFFAERF